MSKKYNFFSDSMFVIGSEHQRQGKPCQDYALNFSDIKQEIALVSDGCSSGGRTSVGARLLLHSILKKLKKQEDIYSPRKFIFNINVFLITLIELLGMQLKDLLATALYVVVDKEKNSIHINLLGDGVIAIKMRDGSAFLYKYDWKGNTPFYPIYLNKLDIFKNAHNAHLMKAIKEEIFYCDSSGNYELLEINEKPLEEGIAIHHKYDDIADIQAIGIFSDGVDQINNLPWQEAVYRLLNFKNFNGVFAKRRMLKFLKKLKKEDKYPQDDLSFSVIYIEYIEEEEEVSKEEDSSLLSSSIQKSSIQQKEEVKQRKKENKKKYSPVFWSNRRNK